MRISWKEYVEFLLNLDWIKKPYIFILILSFALSRVPLLNLGFGRDGDAWLIANSAFDLRMSHIYRTSRLPGYPLPEYANSLIIDHGWIATNSLTMILSLVSVYFFARILKELNAKNKGLLVLTYAFLPILWINSTNTMDYMWGLTFIILTWFLILRKRYTLAGLMMGLAIGSRITSAILIFPFVYLIWIQYKKIRGTVYFGVATIAVSSLLFLPLLVKYGLGFLTYYPGQSRNVLTEVSIRFTRNFGLISTIFGVIAFLLSLKALFKAIAEKETANSFHLVIEKKTVFLLSCVILIVVLFIKEPLEAGYLIPAIPFGLLLLNKILKRGLFVVLCVILLLHSFVPFSFIAPSIIDDGYIMIERNIEKRTAQIEFINDLMRTEVKNHSVVIVGWRFPVLRTLLLLSYLDENVSSYDRYWKVGIWNSEKDIWYRHSLSLDELKEIQSKGYGIYYIKHLRVITKQVFGYDLEDYNAMYLEV